MRHYVLTRAYRGPDYPLDANRRRVEILRHVTARSLAAQGTEWEWIVYIDPTDPLLDERMAAFQSAGVPVIPITSVGQEPIDWSGPVLTTRIDDDDAFAVDAFRRLHQAIPKRRTVLMFPNGHRVNAGMVEPVTHRRNAWASLYAPAGDRIHVRHKAHGLLSMLAPVRFVDAKPAWLWVRHGDAETGFRRADRPITYDVRRRYDVDWSFVEGLT
jgi:hypothetical protein